MKRAQREGDSGIGKWGLTGKGTSCGTGKKGLTGVITWGRP